MATDNENEHELQEREAERERENAAPPAPVLAEPKRDEGVDVNQVENTMPVSLMRLDSYKDDHHINLTWRSWMVVFVTCFAIMAQVFVVVAAGSVIGFIIRDLGDASLAGWIIQGPLLMQSVLSPIVGRLSDVLDRKYLACVPPLIAFAGAVVSARATDMSMLIGGGILIGTTLSTISIVQAIPSEVLPLKFRALANGFAFLGGGAGGLIGSLGAGAATNASPSGWRTIFWIQAGFHLASSVGIFCFYWPPKSTIEYARMKWTQVIWTCDPIGSFLFIVSATLMLLSLDWAGGAYPWSDAHVVAPLTVGLVCLVAFALYEWKGRDDGLVAHVFFRQGPNFALSVFAFAVEGWIFYSAVNSVTPLIVLNLGFQTNAWLISIRQLAFTLPNIAASIPIMLYATWRKDLKTPTLLTFILFLVVCICYACINPSMNHAQIGFNVISGIGQSGPLTLLTALVQFTAPHAYLSTATGLAFSARALGGAFGSAILDTIINGHQTANWAPTLTSVAVSAGLPSSSVPALLAGLAEGSPTLMDDVPGLNESILGQVMQASYGVYAASYRLAWSSIIPFVVLAIVAVLFLKGVRELMTEHVEATVEHESQRDLGMEDKAVREAEADRVADNVV